MPTHSCRRAAQLALSSASVPAKTRRSRRTHFVMASCLVVSSCCRRSRAARPALQPFKAADVPVVIAYAPVRRMLARMYAQPDDRGGRRA